MSELVNLGGLVMPKWAAFATLASALPVWLVLMTALTLYRDARR